jgi:hypothetical protein
MKTTPLTTDAIFALLRDEFPEGASIKLRCFDHAPDGGDDPEALAETSEWHTDPVGNTDTAGLLELASRVVGRADALRQASRGLRKASLLLAEDEPAPTFKLGPYRVAVIEQARRTAPRKPGRTNTELVDDLMSYSPSGALCQVFILQAIEKYADAVLADESATLREMEGGMISGEAWVRCAKHIQGELISHYGK